MKLNEKFPHNTTLRAAWKVYSRCSPHLGVILDNKFEGPLESVYEHTRHTAQEVFNHPAFVNAPLANADRGSVELTEEERDIHAMLTIKERSRRVNVVGDVGVGKTTFVLHLRDVHLGNGFPGRHAVYIDYSDFTASVLDPIPAIHQKFVDSVLSEMESHQPADQIDAIHQRMFTSAKMFAKARLVANGKGGAARERSVRKAVELAIEGNALAYTFERINDACRDDRNALVLVADNIDHLPLEVVRSLFQFFIEVQLKCRCLLIVAMRDHTFENGYSSYRPDKIVPIWDLRLNPPNIRLLLEKRVEHFLPEGGEQNVAEPKIAVGGGVLQLEQSLASVCRSLLLAPLSDIHTYDFLCRYANYNIRELFGTILRILGCPGLEGLRVRPVTQGAAAAIVLGVDECLLAIGLGKHQIFYPDRSPLFNPYSSGMDVDPRDKIIGVRLLQLLNHRTLPLPYAKVRDQMQGWGYSGPALDAQVDAMVNKDILWTSSGAPTAFGGDSALRLSYRGTLYAQRILKRALFNYMVSFDVRSPSDSHSVYKPYKGGLQAEIEALSDFGRNVDTDRIAGRVAGLADVIFEAEKVEMLALTENRQLARFRAEVAPQVACLEIIDGLTRFLNKVIAAGTDTRFLPPSQVTLQHIQAEKGRFEAALAPS
jgi:GTPase SAR1 family protein